VQHVAGVSSIPDVCEVELIGDPRNAPELLIEVPHGATLERHFDAIRGRLRGALPDDLVAFFFVNTDVGAPECARALAELSAPDHGSVLILRCLIPRTFADTNRLLDAPADMGAGITPCIPEYVVDPQDRRVLGELHAAYQDVARRAHAAVCGQARGRALLLHTFAPRTVQIEKLDSGIVDALRRAYAPGVYETWDLRPEVDVISGGADGESFAPHDLIEALRREYGELGIHVAENESYRLHPSTTGYVHSKRCPGRILCVELRRDLLASPFTPFEEMRIDPGLARRMAEPIARALRATRGRP
jgi:hypothetical protein